MSGSDVMKFYVVESFPGAGPSYVAADVGEEEIFVWMPQLERFVYSRDLTREFRDFLSDMAFEPVTADEAAKLVGQREIGVVDRRTQQWLLDEAKQEARHKPVDEVLPDFPELVPVSERVKRAKASRGRWSLYKTYGADKERAAAIRTDDLNKGKVRAFGDKVEARLVATSPDGFRVEVKVPESASGRKRGRNPRTGEEIVLQRSASSGRRRRGRNPRTGEEILIERPGEEPEVRSGQVRRIRDRES